MAKTEIVISLAFLVVMISYSLLLWFSPINIMFMMSYAFNIIFAVVAIIFFLTLGSIPFTFMKAKIGGNPILAVWRKDKKIDLITGKFSEGMIESKKGNWLVVPDSVGLFPNSVAGAIAHQDYGVSLSPDFIRSVTAARLGVAVNIGTDENPQYTITKMRDYGELERFVEDWQKKNPDKELYVRTMNPGGSTLRIQDVVGFFKYNVNPTFIKSRVERKAAEIIAEQRKFPIKWVFAFVMLILGVAIAYVIITQTMGQQAIAQQVADIFRQVGKVPQIFNQTGTSVQ